GCLGELQKDHRHPLGIWVRTPPRVLVVDDNPSNVRVVRARLAGEGYDVVTAGDGEEALTVARATGPDLILLDVMMPKLDGIEVCRRLKAMRDLPFTPIILVTVMTDAKDVVTGLEAGADEYLTKPVDHAALCARVRSMLRIKALHDTVAAQAEEIARWNATLERRVAEQVTELARVSRLKRFFSPQLADAILAGGAADPLRPHRREISVVFLDLRGFTAFAETAEPEEVSDVLRAYHAEIGRLVLEHEGTLERIPRSDPRQSAGLRRSGRPGAGQRGRSASAQGVPPPGRRLRGRRPRAGDGRRLSEHRRGRLLDDRATEEPGIARAPQPHGVGEGEVAEVLERDEPVLDELVGLGEDVRHVGHVEVADVRAEERVEPCAARIDAAVERPGVDRVVSLAAEVEARHEEVAQVLPALDPARGVVVEVVEAAGRVDGLGVGPAVPLAKRRRNLLVPVRPHEPTDHVAIERAGIGVLERPAVALLPVADEIGVQHA